MPARPVGITDTASATTVAEIEVIERASPDLTTTFTADPGSGGTTWAVTNGITKFPAVNNFKVRAESEVVLVTAGAGTNSWTVTRAQDGTTAAAHAIGVTVAAVVGVQRVETVTASRQASFKGVTTTFRTPGRGTTAQNLFSIFNAAGSTTLIAVRRISLQTDSTVVLVAVAPLIKVARSTTLPTSGTTLTKSSIDTGLTSSASVTVLGDASADGTSSGTALTSTPGTAFWSQYGARHNTLVGRTEYTDADVIPRLSDNEPIILRASQGLLVHVIAAATTSNPTTNHYVINAMWEEFTQA